MSDDAPKTAPRVANPFAEIEAIASGAIGRPVRVERVADAIAYLIAPSDTTIHGHRAIVAAMGKARADLVCMVALDGATVEP